MITRRLILAAPAIIAASRLMRVSALAMPYGRNIFAQDFDPEIYNDFMAANASWVGRELNIALMELLSRGAGQPIYHTDAGFMLLSRYV